MSIKLFIQGLAGVCALSAQLAVSAQPALKEAPFSLVDHYIIGGEGHWDLLTLDSTHHRLFISRSTHVQVVDTDRRKVIGDIPDTQGVHAITLADEFNVGFTSNGKSNSVTVFDLATLKVLDFIPISGVNPDAILYDPASRHVFAFNGHSSNATVIDAASRKEMATIPLPGKPELAVSDHAGKVFVNIEDKNEIVVIDSAANKLLTTYALGKGEEPTGLAIDIAHHRLFSVCANRIMAIVDSETGKLIAEIKIGSGPDSAAFDANLGIAFSSNGDGTLTIVKERNPDHFVVLQNVATKKGARTMAYDDRHGRAYLVTASFGKTPPATKEQPKPRPELIPDSFEVLVVARHHAASK